MMLCPQELRQRLSVGPYLPGDLSPYVRFIPPVDEFDLAFPKKVRHTLMG
jgi:hypothetical protein